MAESDLTYAGLTFTGILTTTLEAEPHRDESNTDRWYNKITIGVSCVANVAIFTAANPVVGITGKGAQGATASEVFRNIESILLQDRQNLIYRQDGVIVYTSNPQVDCDNGPKVVQVKVSPMGRGSMRINFVVQIALVGCTENPPPVIGHRFTVSDTIDENHRTIREWRGRLRLSTAVNNVHSFRGMVLPQLSDGFRRTRMHFQGELNALELSYTVTDQQLLGDAAPAQAVKMSGNYTETLGQDGSKTLGQIDVRLDGEPGTDKQVLLEQCMRVINFKLQANQFAQNTSNWRWLSLIISEPLGEDVNAIVATAQVERAITNDQASNGSGSLRLGKLVLATMGRPLDLGGDYSRFRTIPPEAYPCTTVGLFASALSCPCDSHAMPQAADSVGDDESPGRNEDTEQSENTYDPSGSMFEINSPGYSQDHLEAMWTHCNIEAHYPTNEGIVQMPYGDALPNSVATSAMIRLHSPMAKLVLRVSAERIGDWPKIPAKRRFVDANGITYVPLSYRPNFRPPTFLGDSRQLYVIDLEAVWAMNAPPQENGYFVPSLPWDDLPTAVIPSQVFQEMGVL